MQTQLTTKRDLAELESNIRHEIRELENRIIIKTGVMIALSIGITAALVKLL